MLVVSRKAGEKIVIPCDGYEITITVTKVLGNKVRLGIRAPKNIRVLREELVSTNNHKQDKSK